MKYWWKRKRFTICSPCDFTLKPPSGNSNPVRHLTEIINLLSFAIVSVFQSFLPKRVKAASCTNTESRKLQNSFFSTL